MVVKENPIERKKKKKELDQQNTTYENRLTGYFCSDTVFNLSKKVLSDAEIRVLEKGLD